MTMLGRRLLVVSFFGVPLMTMACGEGESSSPMPFTPAGGATSNPSSDPPATNGEPPGMAGMAGSMAVSTPGEATPNPTLDPTVDPDGSEPGMEGMPTEPPPVLPSGGTFEKVVLNNQPGEPISLAVLPDGRVLHSSRDGRIFLHQLDGSNPIAATIPVYRRADNYDEDGLLGLAVAPDFAADPWVYVYYSPPLNTPTNGAPETGNANSFQPYVGVNRLSRFRLEGNQLVSGSEQTILEVTVDRGICCHTGGNIDFDGAGNLYLSTGDDTNPYQDGGHTPIDERPDRNPAFDAQRSSANTNDLRGKLLRIRVQPDGSYTIPEGNLFPEGTANTRPEIYAMGLRNPYRFAVNRANGEVYLADYAPDGQANPTRGPAGTAKWLVARGAANYGWPYCVGHLAYVDRDFATNASGAQFDCDNLRNESPHNTGLVELPPVTDPEFMYTRGAVPGFPDLGNGAVGPMAGPMYAFDPPSTSPIKWPAEYDGGIMFYEWTRRLIADFRLADDGSLASVTRVPVPTVIAPMDMEFGPDGALYVLEYGSAFGGPAPDASLSRIEYRVPAP
jgi:cytochrome c